MGHESGVVELHIGYSKTLGRECGSNWLNRDKRLPGRSFSSAWTYFGTNSDDFRHQKIFFNGLVVKHMVVFFPPGFSGPSKYSRKHRVGNPCSRGKPPWPMNCTELLGCGTCGASRSSEHVLSKILLVVGIFKTWCFCLSIVCLTLFGTSRHSTAATNTTSWLSKKNSKLAGTCRM